MSQPQIKPFQKSVIKKRGAEPQKKIIEPGVFLAMTLDDISRKLSELLISNGSLEMLNKAILKELKDGADEGEYFRQDATANTTTFDTIDFLAIFGFPVRGFMIRNDGANNILYGHNITRSSIDPTVQTIDARFIVLEPHEKIKFAYNRKRINNIYLKSVGGNSDYRLEAVW